MQVGGTSHNGLLRFYSPALGRWLNRDPLEEGGGLNLYAAFFNDPVNVADAYGLASIVEKPLPGGIHWPGHGIYGHAYIWMKRRCNGAHTFGFHAGYGIGGPFGDRFDGGLIESPDSSYQPGVGKHILNNNDARFEAALCQCIKNSMNNMPLYTPGNVCGTWAHDMWDCAKRKLGWLKPWQPGWRGHPGTYVIL